MNNEREEMRRIIWLAKILAVLMLVLIIVEFVSCARSVEGAVITGEKPLGGASLMMQLVYEKEHAFNDVELELLKERMGYMGWDKHFDAHVYRGDSLIAHKIYKDVKTIKVNKKMNTIEVYMEDGTSIPVNADKYTVEIRTRDIWGL